MRDPKPQLRRTLLPEISENKKSLIFQKRNNYQEIKVKIKDFDKKITLQTKNEKMFENDKRKVFSVGNSINNEKKTIVKEQKMTIKDYEKKLISNYDRKLSTSIEKRRESSISKPKATSRFDLKPI